MATSIEKITTVARQCQREFEKKQVPLDLIMKLFLAQRKLEQPKHMLDLLAQQLASFPENCCIPSSLYLNHTLRYLGRIGEGTYIDSRGKSYSHWVVDVGRTTLGTRVVADITGHQFAGGKKLYVGPLVHPRYIREYYGPPKHTKA